MSGVSEIIKISSLGGMRNCSRFACDKPYVILTLQSFADKMKEEPAKGRYLYDFGDTGHLTPFLLRCSR